MAKLEIYKQIDLYQHLKQMGMNVYLEVYKDKCRLDILVCDGENRPIKGIEVKQTVKDIDFDQLNKYSRVFGVEVIPIAGTSMLHKFKHFVRRLQSLKRIKAMDLLPSNKGGIRHPRDLDKRNRKRRLASTK